MMRIAKPLLSALTLALLMFPVAPGSLAQKTRLHTAVPDGPEKVREMLPGRQVNAQTPEGETALHWAVRHNMALRHRERVEVIRLLMDAGADPTILNNEGDAPLHIASERSYYIKGARHVVLRELLRRGADANVADGEGGAPMHRAMDFSKHNPRENRIAVIRALIAAGGDPLFPNADGVTPLHMAARWGLVYAAPMLATSSRLNLNATDNEGLTPIHYAMERGERPPYTGSPEEIAELLLSRGANPHVSGNGAPTPWERAWESGDAAFARLFINIPNLNGDTPLTEAFWRDDGAPDLDYVGRLLAAGADVNHRDESGNTPLHRAVSRHENGRVTAGRWETVEFLLDNGANPNLRNNRGETPARMVRDLTFFPGALHPDMIGYCRDSSSLRCRVFRMLRVLCDAADEKREECE